MNNNAHVHAQARAREHTFYWAHTSDLHGAIFSYDYLHDHPVLGGLPSIYSYLNELRKSHPGHVILTDGGDVLQGQPTSYFYNFIKTDTPHLIADAMNELDYDAQCLGNHDIETGHEVYDRYVSSCKAPILGANIIDERTGQPYLRPYIIIERQGVRIAILGMITPGIPNWLPKVLWENLRFEEMVSSARHWIDIIKEKEQPDLIVGVFHSGFDGGMVFPEYRENATEEVAKNVPGFDLICYGHDHNPRMEKVVNINGDTVVCIGPQDAGTRLSLAKIHLKYHDGHLTSKRIWAENVHMVGSQTPDAMAFEALFTDQRQELSQWVNDTIGTITEDLLERDAFFGPSLFMSLIHQLQLYLTGADISFAAPISFDSKIRQGSLTVRDMFALYKYENLLYTIRMTGREIKDYLEMSYGMWTNQMHTPDDHILCLDTDEQNPRRHGLHNLSYNMDSAAGMIYEVDVTKPEGSKVRIYRMRDGSTFSPDKEYLVAVNSYRGNGGGELLTKGAGIPRDSLSSRVVSSTDKDMRYYLMKRIIELGTVRPHLMSNWRFVPTAWAEEALRRDRQQLFPE